VRLATLARVIIPNLRGDPLRAVPDGAVVIGEYTIADTLLKETLPRFQRTTGREPQAGYGLQPAGVGRHDALFILLSLLITARAIPLSRLVRVTP
jgi:hypothetical protein